MKWATSDLENDDEEKLIAREVRTLKITATLKYIASREFRWIIACFVKWKNDIKIFIFYVKGVIGSFNDKVYNK